MGLPAESGLTVSAWRIETSLEKEAKRLRLYSAIAGFCLRKMQQKLFQMLQMANFHDYHPN
jgi:hypothetical protein